METQDILVESWVNGLLKFTQNYGNVKSLRVDLKPTEKGTYELRLFQDEELIHKATYPNKAEMSYNFPRTFAYIISEGIESFNQKRK